MRDEMHENERMKGVFMQQKGEGFGFWRWVVYKYCNELCKKEWDPGTTMTTKTTTRGRRR